MKEFFKGMPLFDLFVSAGSVDSQLLAAILQTHQQAPSQQAPPRAPKAGAPRQRLALQELPSRQLTSPEARSEARKRPEREYEVAIVFT